MNHPENTVTNWRDYIAELNPTQISRMEAKEAELKSWGEAHFDPAFLMDAARRYAADNMLCDTLFADMCPPPDATDVGPWTADSDGEDWHRRFTGTVRRIEGEPRDCECSECCAENETHAGTVAISGTQFATGRIIRHIAYVWLRDEASPADGRALGEALLDAAAEIKRLETQLNLFAELA